MRKINLVMYLLIMVLALSTFALPGTINCQQNFSLANTNFVPDSSQVTLNSSGKNLSDPSKVTYIAENQTEPSPAIQKISEPDKTLNPPYDQIINRAAEVHQVDPALIKAIIMAESRYNPKAVSKRGAEGLMQLMPVTAKSLGVVDSFNQEDNINGGVMYFKKLLDRFDGDIKLALAAYNAGSRNVRNYGGVPPLRQTHTYIHKVFKYHKRYQQEVEKSDKVV